MSRRRRRRGGKRVHSLAKLLDRQPKSLRKHPYYGVMMSHYSSSGRLQSLRMNATCYRLLDKAVITAENLPNLYRTYRIPKDPFFPLFLRIKLDYLDERRRISEEREKYILGKIKELPPVRRRIIRFLAEWEEELSRGKSRRCWEKTVYPGSKKRALELLGLSDSGWLSLYSEFLTSLEERYRLSPVTVSRVKASLALQLVPEIAPESALLIMPGPEQIKKAYRRLSRIYHPDSGGDSPLFITIGESRDLLLGR